MNNAIFLDIPHIIKTNSKQAFPIHREDWSIAPAIIEQLKQYTNLDYKVFLVGNYPNIPVRKRENNPIENLFTNIANSLETSLNLKPNSIHFDYTTDSESFDYLPCPGMFYNLAYEHDIILPYSFIITSSILGKFIQQYSSVKSIIL